MNWERWLNTSLVLELPEPDIEKELREDIMPEWPNKLKWIPEPCIYCGIRLDRCTCEFNYPDCGNKRIERDNR